MKKLILFSAFIASASLALAFFTLSQVNLFITDQLATVIKATDQTKKSCPGGQGSIFSDEIVIHVNKDESLPADYIPAGLTSISKTIRSTNDVCIKQEVASHLEQMFSDAKKKNIVLAVTSGFRSPETQSIIYKALLFLKGEKAKDRIAEPLHSEHQLGTTVDLTGKSIGYASADDRFDKTKEDLWLKKNAYKYGFVLSYPKADTKTTGYDYEPWHYRYMGIDIAKQIFDKQVSVEEYFSTISN
jgi:D-alanyl-D-alanine carboxypeptidase